jgi:hypothetical protein
LNLWKPPEAWDCPHDEPETSEITPWKSLELPFQLVENGAGFAKGQEYPSIEINYLQRSIGIMQAASQNIVLQRLKEEWVGADASVSLRLELEKQFWMLSALRRKSGPSSDPPVSKPTKVLSLYENYGTSTSSAHKYTLNLISVLILPFSAYQRNRAPSPFYYTPFTRLFPQYLSSFNSVTFFPTTVRYRYLH